MNSQTYKVFSNENLVNIIIPFLSINDIINLTSSNKTIKENNDKIYKEICKKTYSSSYDEYSIIYPLENNYRRKNEELTIEFNNNFNWRRFFIRGKQIEFLFKQNLNIENIPSFKSDTITFYKQFFSILKGIIFI